MKKFLSALLALCLFASMALTARAETFTDAHGDEIILDTSLEAVSDCTLTGAGNASRMGETNLGDFWADALRWFAVSGKINEFFDEDDILSGNASLAVDAEHTVALWNGGNLRDDIPAGVLNAETLARVLPYPNKAAVVYMTGAQLLEALEAASQALPYTEENASACAALMQVSGLRYTIDTGVAYDAAEEYGEHWFRAGSLGRVTVDEVNGQPFDPSALYAVITSNANYNGMDASYVFAEAVAAHENSAITTAAVRDVVWMYLKEALDGHIGQDYAAPQGRITVQ